MSEKIKNRRKSASRRAGVRRSWPMRFVVWGGSLAIWAALALTAVIAGYSRFDSEYGRASDRFYLMRFVDRLASEYPYVPPGMSSVRQELRAFLDRRPAIDSELLPRSSKP